MGISNYIDTAEIETPKTDTITPRELRRILYQLDDQSMTVEQLRKALFDVDNQDEPLSIDIQMFRKWGIE